MKGNNKYLEISLIENRKTTKKKQNQNWVFEKIDKLT